MYRARFVNPQPGVFRLDFDRALDDRPVESPSACSPQAGLPVDVWEEGDILMLQAAVPGFTAEMIDITLRDTRLTLEAEALPEATESTERTWLLRERRPTGFERRLRLPYPVDVEATQATVRDGILTLVMPKAAVARAHKVAVTSEETVGNLGTPSPNP